MKADLHVHSTFSDGSSSIAQLIGMAKENGLDCIAITDHDTLSHIRNIPAAGEIKVIGGVEMSAIHRNTGVKAHILGYNIQKPGILSSFVQPTLEARSRNSEKQIDILTGLGFKIDISNIPRTEEKYIYKQHIMDWLFSTGQTSDMFGVFYQKTFKNGGACAFDIEYPDVFEAVRAVKEAGGLAVLAHPGQQNNFSLIPGLSQAGLDGLELNHYSNNESDRKLIAAYAERYGLFLTGGSDYHGKYGAHHFNIGDFLSEESGIKGVEQSGVQFV